MTPERYALVRALYDAVIDLPATSRAQALREQAAAHPNPDELIEAVMGLVDAAESPTFSHISRPMQTMIGSLNVSNELPNVAAGDVFGAWRVVRPLGEGGMGSVWLVERRDANFTQEAALKFVKGMLREQTLNYFTRERQILADLSHPHIARLFDGGTTPQGQPFLVMEYIDGERIDRYVGARKLTRHAVLGLFQQVFSAVSFAHQELIVHCDLKPSNVLVNAMGYATLIDFGIARLIDSASVVDALSGSTPGSAGSPTTTLAYTPHYASPELREGKPVSTKTDIYALGVMLGEMLKLATEAKALDADLTAIIGKATAKKSAHRYDSVNAFADDVRRYLTHEPVAARVPTLAYRAERLVRRRWPWVVAGSVFAMTVVGFTSRVVIERDRAQKAEQVAVKERDAKEAARGEALRERDDKEAARREALKERDSAAAAERVAARDRDRAQASERLAVRETKRAGDAEIAARKSEKSARETNDFLLSVFNAGSPDAQTGDPPASKMLAAAEARLDANLPGQPATQAELFLTMGHVQSQMGNFVQASKNYRRAIEIERSLAGTQKRPLKLADVLGRLAALDANFFGGKEARALAVEAVALAEQYAAPDSVDLAAALTAYGRALDRVGSPADATPVFRRAVAVLEKAAPEGHHMAAALYSLGLNLSVRKQYDEAITALRRAKTLHEKNNGVDDINALGVMEPLAHAHIGRKEFTEAEAVLREVLAKRQKLHGKYNHRYTVPYLLLGDVIARTGRLRDAQVISLSALENTENTVGRENSGYVVALHNTAYWYDVMGNDTEATRLYEQVIALSFKAYKRPHPAPARYESNFGRMLARVGRVDEALPHLEAAYDMYKRLYGEKRSDTAEALLELVVADARANRIGEALAKFRQYETLLPQNDIDVRVREAEARALIASAEGRIDDAIRHYEETERLTLQMRNPQDARYWLARLPRAELLAQRNAGDDRAESRKLAEEILARVGSELSPEAGSLVRLRQLQQR